MRSGRVGAAAAAAVTLLTACAAGAGVTWSYNGKSGPNNWASLDVSYEACGSISGQTPIDLRPTPADHPHLHFRYQDEAAEVFNNGHTVEAEVPVESGNAVVIDGVEYKFLEMHFHAPAEHKFRGKTYPVEVHFVNKSEGGTVAVVGVFIEIGKEDNAAWEPFIEHLGVSQSDGKIEAGIDFDALLPYNRQTIQYTGSLTTPPCSGGVRWNVMSTVVQLSNRQITAFKNAYRGNNRPIQRTAGRTVQIDTTVDNEN